MKSISNSDFSLLMEKLPVLLALARKPAQQSGSLRTANAIRLLGLFVEKHQKNYQTTKNKKDDKK
ncbi:MAG: hypothetical protein NC217_00090 [Muribaculaceae bacterium]|nr:hypothetical protein [Muribaculaceae bacterium]